MKQIPMTTKNGRVERYATVDDEDYERLSAFSWHCCRGYARRVTGYRPGTKSQYVQWMHRDVLDLHRGDGGVVDHINGDRLDNRRSNLRLVNWNQSARNRGLLQRPKKSGIRYKGVHLEWNGSFRARIRAGAANVSLGLYPTPEDAAEAYDAAAVRLHGPHARTNRMLGLLV